LHNLLKRIVICGAVAVVCWLCVLILDRSALSQGLIRFHVVAASDSEEDQSVKLKVRDAVMSSIQDDLERISDISEAKKYLEDNLPKIENIVCRTLEENGFPTKASVQFCREAFPIRHYDTFSLPAGVYDSLRIVIGQGKGKNWWCVAFPSLCIPATSAAFCDAAVHSGFSERLSEVLSGNEKYSIRFYFLDRLGELENICFSE